MHFAVQAYGKRSEIQADKSIKIQNKQRQTDGKWIHPLP